MWMHRNLTSYHPVGIDTYKELMPVEGSTSAVAGSEGVVPSFSTFSLPAGNGHVAVCSVVRCHLLCQAHLPVQLRRALRVQPRAVNRIAPLLHGLPWADAA